MGRPDITDVIGKLQERGYRTARAFPGKRMPHIQKPAVAVALQKEASDTQILAVTVLYPEIMGGGACEDDARLVAQILREMGYDCVQEHCQYDGKSDRFSVRVLATWADAQAAAPYSVSIDGVLMKYAIEFSAEQKVEVLPIGAMGQTVPVGMVVAPQLWSITLEELIPRDTEVPAEPAEPFAMVVRRGTIGEYYQNCYWTGCSRRDTQLGLRLVRTGVALTRSVLDYG